jgi:Fe-S oxidoreductase
MDIPISSTIADSKVVMVNKGFGPLPRHNEMVENLLKHRNAVNKDPKDRLAWLGDDAPAATRQTSDTLLYLGCMASYLDKETAKACYAILKHAGESFTLLEDEFCCGIYPYNAGKTTEATAVFKDRYDLFKARGIKRIITPCAGCYRAFSAYYPRVLPGFDIEVKHISQVIQDLVERKKIVFTPAEGDVVVHDSCKIGRKSGVYEAPRMILRQIGFDVKEIPENKENGLCCGAGAGVRSIEPQLSVAIGRKILDTSPAEHVVSTCPFCIFNLSYIARKTDQPHTIKHIASFVLPHIR